MELASSAEGVARVAAGIVFVVAGLATLRIGPDSFARAFRGYRILPASLAAPLARAIPVGELAIGGALVVGVAADAAAMQSRGMQPDLHLAYGTDAYLASDRALSGYFAMVPFANERGDRARLYYGLEAGGGTKSFANVWDAHSADTTDVFDVMARRPRRRSTITFSAEDALVRYVGVARSASASTRSMVRAGAASPRGSRPIVD